MHRDGDQRRQRRGAKLAEVALFLSIAMAIVVGGLSTYREANVAAEVSAQARVLTALVAEARALPWHSARDAGGGRIDATLAAAGAVPAAIVAPAPLRYGSRLLTQWQGELALTVVDLGRGERLHLRLHDIPVPACTRLTPVAGSGLGVFADGIDEVRIAGPDGAARGGRPPLSISATATLCSAAAGGADGTATVTFVLGLR